MRFSDFCFACALPSKKDFLSLKSAKALNTKYLKTPRPLKGMSRGFYQRLKQLDLSSLEKEFQKANRFVLLRLDQKQYPSILKEIPDPPVYLFVWGRVQPLQKSSLSFVGSRRATVYGKKAVYNLIFNLKFPWVIVSGLAIGVDSFSHQAALESDHQTVAVLGSGFFSFYPRVNQNLAKKIVRNRGVLISEYPPHFTPERYYFLSRNRIIAGLSLATVVVEAGEKSGSLSTASYAARYGREVMAVPGDIFRLTSKGCFSLMRQGAKPVFEASDIEEDFVGFFPEKKKEEKKDSLALFLSQPKHLEEIQKKFSLSAQETLAKLSELELKGKIKNIGSGFYQAL